MQSRRMVHPQRLEPVRSTPRSSSLDAPAARRAPRAGEARAVAPGAAARVTTIRDRRTGVVRGTEGGSSAMLMAAAQHDMDLTFLTARRGSEHAHQDYGGRAARIEEEREIARQHDRWTDLQNRAGSRARRQDHHLRLVQTEVEEDADGAQGGAVRKIAPCHWGMLVLALFLSIISVPLIYSASTAIALDHHGSTDFFLRRQIAFVLMGMAVMVAVSRLSRPQVRSVVWCLYGLSLMGLLATRFTPLGFSMGGVERWLKLGPLPIQCSEIAKFALVGVLADFWSRAALPSQRSGWPWIPAVLLTLPMAGLVFMQPHLSAAALLFLVPFYMACYAAVPWRQVLGIVSLLAVGAVMLVGMCRMGEVPFLQEYQRERIVSHLTVNGRDDQGSHYQVLQGQRALRLGGVLGAGPAGSIYKQGHLPAPHTDFILAVIGEEWGLAGTLFLLLCYGLMVFFCFHTGFCADSGFEALLCSGVGTMLAIQVVCNAGVVTGLLPVTGVPLPLLSYGGSGLICSLMGIGLVLSVSRHSK